MPSQIDPPEALSASEDAGPPVVVPHGEIPPDTLRALIEAFVLREGTEYGERDVLLDTKVAQVLRQLERREAQVLFDPATESVDIVPATGLRIR